MEDYRTLLHEPARLDPPLGLFGGVAEDLLLDGELTRPHNDVDVLVPRDDLSARIEDCERLGFAPIAARYEPMPGRPLACGGRRGELELELGVADRDADGYFFVTGDSDGRAVRVRVSGDPFSREPLRFEGCSIRVVTPLALYEIRAGFALAGTFGEQGSKHALAQERLRAAFFPERDPASLTPRIEPAPMA